MKKKEYRYEELTPKQKAAILLMSLDVDTASKVFKQLSLEEVEQIALESRTYKIYHKTLWTKSSKNSTI